MYDAVVVGGGLAGLSAGWKTRHRNVLVLEKENRVGGRIRSERRGPYWLNWGGHVYGGPASTTGRLLDSVGVDAAPVPGQLGALAMNGKLLTDGRIETYPFRVPMSWGSRAALLKAGARVRLAVMKYAKITRPRRGETFAQRQQRIYDYLNDRTFTDFVGELPEDADALFRPTVSRSAGEPEQVSAGAGVGYFHLVWDRSGGLSRNIVGGPSTLTDTIAASLGDKVVRGAAATAVVLHDKYAEITYVANGDELTVTAKHVIMATPAPVTRKIVKNLPRDLDDALGQIVYGPYVSSAFLTNEHGPAPWDDCYAIASPKRSFNVAFNMSSLIRGSETSRQPGSSIMVFSPGNLARRLIDRDDDEILDTYLSDLDQIFPSLPPAVVESEVQHWPLGLAYCFPGRGKLQPTLTANYGILKLAGDYLGTGYTETSVQTGFAAGTDVLSALTEPGHGAAEVLD